MADMDANKLYYTQEDKTHEVNMIKFQEFLDLFYQTVGLNFDKLVAADINSDDPIEKFNYLKYLVSTCFKKYREVFYEVLSGTNYNMKCEMIDAMKLLGQQTNLKYASDVIEYLLEHPYIDAIETAGPKIIVKSDYLGDQAFYSAREYLSDNLEARSVLIGDLTHRCHQVSLELLNVLKDHYLTTSLVPYYFDGAFYHSYIKDKNMTIDAVNHIVMPHEEYNKLFDQQEIISMNYEELYKEYISCINEGLIKEADGFYIPVAVTLAKQLRKGGR